MDGVRDSGTAEWIYLTLLVKKKKKKRLLKST